MESPGTIKRYNLAPPTEQDLLVSLNRLVGPDESRQLWAAACHSTGSCPPSTLDQFERALLQLKEGKGMASIAAISILVRLKSYRTLAMMNAK